MPIRPIIIIIIYWSGLTKIVCATYYYPCISGYDRGCSTELFEDYWLLKNPKFQIFSSVSIWTLKLSAGKEIQEMMLKNQVYIYKISEYKVFV